MRSRCTGNKCDIGIHNASQPWDGKKVKEGNEMVLIHKLLRLKPYDTTFIYL